MQKIAIIAYEGISLFHLSVPMAIFKDALSTDQPIFDIDIYAEKTGRIKTACGLDIYVSKALERIDQADIIIFPSWIPEERPSPKMVYTIKRALKNDKRLVGLCLGAYALAYAGVLNNKAATSHWKYAQDFSQRFPDVHFDSNPLYLVEGNIITSAGSAAAIDCCLHIVSETHGVKVANQIARMMVSAPSRAGGQNQYIEEPTLSRPADQRLTALIDNILADLSAPITLDAAAHFCAMSVRSFTRHFKNTQGSSFVPWLVNARLNFSLGLLETSKASIAHIALTAGFSSEQLFRKHFKQRYQVTPGEWRKLFQTQN